MKPAVAAFDLEDVWPWARLTLSAFDLEQGWPLARLTLSAFDLVRVSIADCKTKSKIIITANQNKGKKSHRVRKRREKKSKLFNEWENAGDQVTIFFLWIWLFKIWREFSEPITCRVKQNRANSALLSRHYKNCSNFNCDWLRSHSYFNVDVSPITLSFIGSCY